MRSKVWWAVGWAAALSLLLVGTIARAADAPAMPETAKAFLTGDQEAPAVDSMALGYMVVTHSADGMSVHFKLVVANIDDVTVAHIHLGERGVAGPVVGNLFTGPAKECNFSGVLAEGDFTAADLMGPLAGKTMEDLGKAGHGGMLYVNVHTKAHPDGDIRGQIMARPTSKPPAAPATPPATPPATGGGAY